MISQTTSTSSMARIGGTIEVPSRRHQGSRTRSGSSSTSSPAPTAAVSSRSTSSVAITESSSAGTELTPVRLPGQAGHRPAGRARSGVAGDLLTQPQGDLGGQRADRRVLDGARPADVHPPLADDTPGAGGQQYHPLTQPHRLAHVVRHEDDAVAGGLPHPGELVVHD